MGKNHMSHIRNLVGIIEDKGYMVASIKWNGDGTQIEIIIDNPALMGNKLFLDQALENKARDTAEN